MLSDYASTLGTGALVVLACIVAMIVQWKIVDVLTPQDDAADLRGGNLAEAIERGCLALSQAIGLAFAAAAANIPGIGGVGSWRAWGIFAAGAAYITLLPLVTRPFLNHVLLPTIDDDDAIAKGNIALAWTRGGAFLGIGCIAGASLIGSTATWWEAVLSTGVFFVLGLFLITAIYWLHERLTPYNLYERISTGLLGAGIESGTLLLAVSMVTAVGVAGDVDSWVESLAAFGLTALLALLLLLPSWYILTAFGPGHLPHALHNDENDAGSIVAGILLIGLALIVTIVVSIS